MGSLQQREECKLKTLRSVDVWFAFVHLPGREHSYQNIYNVGPIMGELVTLSKKIQNVHFAPPPPPPPHSSSICFSPSTPEAILGKSVDQPLVTGKTSSTILVRSLQNADCRLDTKCTVRTSHWGLLRHWPQTCALIIIYVHVLFINTLHFLIFLEDQLICY